MGEVRVKAYAKINLILDVLSKRADGYHEVEMIMQAISLYDLITLKTDIGITLTTNNSLIPVDKGNLAYQAALLMMEKFPHISGVMIDIKKHIPIEAGLAGGSTDAAAVILGLDKLYNLNLPQSELLNLGASLGSDVPFCLLGPTAFAFGRGEKLRTVPSCPQLWVVLVKPQFGVKTAEVYQGLKLTQINSHPNIKGYLAALEAEDIPYLLDNLENVLETSTFTLYPQVEALKNKLKGWGVKNIVMSGSGPTILALFATEIEAQDLANNIENEGDYQVFVAHTLSQEVINERVKIV